MAKKVKKRSRSEAEILLERYRNLKRVYTQTIKILKDFEFPKEFRDGGPLKGAFLDMSKKAALDYVETAFMDARSKLLMKLNESVKDISDLY